MFLVYFDASYKDGKFFVFCSSVDECSRVLNVLLNGGTSEIWTKKTEYDEYEVSFKLGGYSHYLVIPQDGKIQLTENFTSILYDLTETMQHKLNCVFLKKSSTLFVLEEQRNVVVEVFIINLILLDFLRFTPIPKIYHIMITCQARLQILFVGSAPSNFRPMNAKAIYERFTPKGGVIYDFCCVSGDIIVFSFLCPNFTCTTV